MNSLKQSLSPIKDEGKNDDPEMNYFGKRISPGKKTRSGMAMFKPESGFDKVGNDKYYKDRAVRETEEKEKRVNAYSSGLFNWIDVPNLS